MLKPEKANKEILARTKGIRDSVIRKVLELLGKETFKSINNSGEFEISMGSKY